MPQSQKQFAKAAKGCQKITEFFQPLDSTQPPSLDLYSRNERMSQDTMDAFGGRIPKEDEYDEWVRKQIFRY